MAEPIFEILTKYWESLRVDDQIPYRSQIDPRLVPDALENIFLLENTAPQQFRIRQTGLHLCEMMGFEVRGQLASSIMNSKYREKFARLLEQVLVKPSIAEITLVAQDFNDNIVSLKMLLLPLRSDFGDINRVIGCISPTVVPYTAPIRFGIAGQKLTQIQASLPSLQGFAERQSAFGTDDIRAVTNNEKLVQKSSPKRGHLRLVTNSDQET